MQSQFNWQPLLKDQPRIKQAYLLIKKTSQAKLGKIKKIDLWRYIRLCEEIEEDEDKKLLQDQRIVKIKVQEFKELKEIYLFNSKQLHRTFKGLPDEFIQKFCRVSIPYYEVRVQDISLLLEKAQGYRKERQQIAKKKSEKMDDLVKQTSVQSEINRKEAREKMGLSSPLNIQDFVKEMKEELETQPHQLFCCPKSAEKGECQVS